jgi:hypothetical protein
MCSLRFENNFLTIGHVRFRFENSCLAIERVRFVFYLMCSLRFENNLLTIEGVRFDSISKKTPLSTLSFAFVSLALPFLVYPYSTALGQIGPSMKTTFVEPLQF